MFSSSVGMAGVIDGETDSLGKLREAPLYVRVAAAGGGGGGGGGSGAFGAAAQDHEDFAQLFLADVDNDSDGSDVDGDALFPASDYSRVPRAISLRSAPEKDGADDDDDDDIISDWALLMESSKAIDNSLQQLSSEIRARGSVLIEAQSSESRPGPQGSGPSDALLHPSRLQSSSDARENQPLDVVSYPAFPESEDAFRELKETVRELLSEMVSSVAFACSAHVSQSSDNVEHSPQTNADSIHHDCLPQIIEDDFEIAVPGTEDNFIDLAAVPIPIEAEVSIDRIAGHKGRVKVRSIVYYIVIFFLFLLMLTFILHAIRLSSRVFRISTVLRLK